MSPVITDIEDVFQAMLLKVPEFTDSLPSGDLPADHVIWMSSFEEILEADIFRPLAFCLNTPFAALRTTEGNSDLPLYDSGILLQLQRNHEDFNTDDPQVSRRLFKEWYGAIFDTMADWKQTDMQFLRFVSSSIVGDPCRTEQAKRGTEDDFWRVDLHFEIDGGQSE